MREMFHCQGRTGSNGNSPSQSGPSLQAEFSTLIGRGPTRLGSHWLIGIMMLLCLLSYAIKTQQKARNTPKGFGCLKSCLYGISELASAIPQTWPRHGVENSAYGFDGYSSQLFLFSHLEVDLII